MAKRKRRIEERARFDGIELPADAAGDGIIAMRILMWGNPDKPGYVSVDCRTLKQRERAIRGYTQADTHMLRWYNLDAE